MKLLIPVLTVLLAFGWQECCAQKKASGVLYDDAVTFFNKSRPGQVDGDQLIAIISFYARKKLTNDEVKTLLQNNKLLKDYKDLIADDATKAIKESGVPQAGGLLNTSLTATNFADGVAKFLIERGKQEISMAFFDRMRNEFDRTVELKFLLPITYEIIKNLESHNILNLLQELREAVIKDLNVLPTNILRFRKLTIQDIKDACPKTKDSVECIKRIKEIRDQFRIGDKKGNAAVEPVTKAIALLIMQSMVDGDDIITVFDKISTDDEFCESDLVFMSYVKLSAIIMNCLRSTKESEGLFISGQNANQLIRSKELFDILFGLAIINYENEKCYAGLKINGVKLGDILVNLAASRTKFTDITSSAGKVSWAHLVISGSMSESKESIEGAYKSLFANSVNIAAKSIQLVASIAPDPSDTNGGSVKKFTENLKVGADVCTDISEKNYAALFIDLSRFVTINEVFKDNQKTQDIVMKYLAFGSNLASASSSDEVKDAIDAVALPPGSYTVKRSSVFNVALNGYIGYAWDIKSKELYARGIYAPLGLSLNTGFRGKGCTALTVFVGIIDVGAIVSYRIIDNTNENLKQDVRLESIVSPSAQVLIGVPKLPVVVGAGWRRTPRLFYDGQATFTTVAPADVFNVNILIDIPITNFVNLPPRR